jgi:hypothetical protein
VQKLQVAHWKLGRGQARDESAGTEDRMMETRVLWLGFYKRKKARQRSRAEILTAG